MNGIPGTDRWAPRVRLTAMVFALVVSAAAAAIEITELYTDDKVRYEPNQPVTIKVVLESSTAWTGNLTLEVWRLAAKVHTKTISATVPASGTATASFPSWTPPPDSLGVYPDFVGFLARATAGTSARFTAIDVSSDWRRYPRYGFLTAFQSGVSPSVREEKVNRLARDYHLNAVQFYDWMWRHEHVIQRDSSGAVVDPWKEWTGDELSFAGIQDFIAKAHAKNMAAIPYFQIYVGIDRDTVSGYDFETYSGVDPLWRLFYMDLSSTKHDFHSDAPLGDPPPTFFYAFNPLNLEWQKHIGAQVEDAVKSGPFDGIHFDQLDKPTTDFKGWCDSGGGDLYLNTGFAPIIRQTREKLDSLTSASGPPKAQTFNLVDGNIDYWHVNDIVWNSDVDFLYSEIWNNKKYGDLHKFIRWAREESRGKPIVLAAYMNMDYAYPAPGVPQTFEEHSVRLADAAFFASGAFHLELGDGEHMLSGPFFDTRPGHVMRLMSSNLKLALRDYYNFATAYEEILFAPELFYGDRGIQWIEIQGKEVLGDGVENTIWYLARRSANYEVIHLINLPAEDPTYTDIYGYWRDPIFLPFPSHSNLMVKYWVGLDATVNGVYVASPDFNGGMSESRPFASGTDARGKYVSFEVPKLDHWDMVYIDRHITPPGHRYQAEDGIRYANPPSPSTSYPPVASTLPDYTGTGYVTFSGSSPASSSVSFWISVPSHSGYALQMRYANPGSNLDASVFLDGNPAGKFLLPAVNPGFTWATAEINVHLRPGPHQVVVLPPSAPLQIDYLQPCLPINGLKGEYFGTQTLTQLAFTRTDRTIYFDWGTGSPANPTLASYFPTNHFSARWTGTVSPPFKADYTFVVIADDGVRLFVDGKPVIDEWAVPTMAPKRSTSLPIPLDPMVKSKYDITLEYFENDGLASVQLLWSATISSVLAIPEQVIAEDYLFPSPYEPDPGLGAPFRRGDVDLNGVLELTDAIVIFHFVHMGVPVPCVDACDVDDNSAVDDADGHAVLNYLFLGSGVPPVCPFPYCGRDLTPDSLTCLMSSCQ